MDNWWVSLTISLDWLAITDWRCDISVCILDMLLLTLPVLEVVAVPLSMGDGDDGQGCDCDMTELIALSISLPCTLFLYFLDVAGVVTSPTDKLRFLDDGIVVHHPCARDCGQNVCKQWSPAASLLQYGCTTTTVEK